MDLLNDWISTNIFEPAMEEFIIEPSGKYRATYKIQYDPEARIPAYWVLPISNFLCEFRQNPTELKNHPLRMDENNEIIKFNFDGEPGFIEPLADYEVRKKDLLSGRACFKITAMMIGSIGPKHIHGIDYPSLSKWFPFTFLPLLGFAVGNDISSPCIEIRDDNRRLVRRIIIELDNPTPFSRGRAVIDENIDLGIGCLLTCLPPEHRGDTYLRVLLKHATRAGLSCHDVEEKMSYIIRGFDLLGENYDLGVQQLTRYLDLNQKNQVKNALNFASKQIEIEAEKAKNSGQLLQCSCLKRIAGRTVNAGNTDRNFGLEVVELLNKFGLPDEDIVAKYYMTSLNYSKDWISILNDYRGKPMHPGFFDFENAYDFENVYVVARHLHDILIRIVLKELKYNGTYRPAIFIPKDVTLRDYISNEFNADWINPNTPAIALGYITEAEKELVQKRNNDRMKKIKSTLRRRGLKGLHNCVGELLKTDNL